MRESVICKLREPFSVSLITSITVIVDFIFLIIIITITLIDSLVSHKFSLRYIIQFPMLPCYLPFWTVLLTSKIPKIWRILSVSPETLSFVYDDLLIYSVSSSAFLCSSRIMDYKSSHSLAFLTSPVSLCESTEFHSAQREFHLHVACAISFIMLVRFFKLRCIAFLKQTLLYQIFSALK